VCRACRCLFLAVLLGQLPAKNLNQDGLCVGKEPKCTILMSSGTANAGGPVRPIDVAFTVHRGLVKCAICTALCNYTARCGSQFRVVWLGLVRICGVGMRQDGLWLFLLPFAVVQSCRTFYLLIAQSARQTVSQSRNECDLVSANC